MSRSRLADTRCSTPSILSSDDDDPDLPDLLPTNDEVFEPPGRKSIKDSVAINIEICRESCARSYFNSTAPVPGEDNPKKEATGVKRSVEYAFNATHDLYCRPKDAVKRGC